MKFVIAGADKEAIPYIEAVLRRSADTLCGVITKFEPCAEVAALLKEKNIPTFESVKAFFEEGTADLVIVASPVGSRKDYGMGALYRTDVLCAAPLMGEHVYGIDLKQEAIRWKRKLGVGFGWNYTAAMRQLKADIAAGKLGKVKAVKGMVAPVRTASYYADSEWRGKMYDAKTRYHVYDGIVTDGGDDLLQNMMEITRSYITDGAKFLLGRAHEIETFDTCLLKGTTELGCSVFYAASSVSDKPSLPVFEYTFEKGTVYYNGNQKDELKAVLADGTEIVYGALLADVSFDAIIDGMLECLGTDEKPICDADATFHQLILSNLLFDNIDAVKELTAERDGDAVTVAGLANVLQTAYETETLPEAL